jgi:hypothetical protein
MVEGRQYGFDLEKAWKSSFPPQLGMVVEVELEAAGQVINVVGIPQTQLDKEQEVAHEELRKRGLVLKTSLVPTFGKTNLACAGVLLGTWFLLPAIATTTSVGTLSFTYWDLLEVLNSGAKSDGAVSGSVGAYGLMALIALAGPFLHYVWNDRRISLAGFLPLIFSSVTWLATRGSFWNILRGFRGDAYQELTEELRGDLMKAGSLKVGFYISILASLYFAADATKRYIAALPERESKRKALRAAA